jgi:hypothetical protein
MARALFRFHPTTQNHLSLSNHHHKIARRKQKETMHRPGIEPGAGHSNQSNHPSTINHKPPTTNPTNITAINRHQSLSTTKKILLTAA